MALTMRCLLCYGPLTRYATLRVAHVPGMPEKFSPPPRVSDPDMHHGTCVMPWCMPGSLTSGFFEIGGWQNVPGIPGTCSICSFTYLVRCPRWWLWGVGCAMTVCSIFNLCCCQTVLMCYKRSCCNETRPFNTKKRGYWRHVLEIDFLSDSLGDDFNAFNDAH